MKSSCSQLSATGRPRGPDRPAPGTINVPSWTLDSARIAVVDNRSRF